MSKEKKKFGPSARSVMLPARAVDGFKEKSMSRRRHQKGQLLKLEHGWAVRVYDDYMQDGQRRRRRSQKYLGDFEKLPTRRSALNRMAEELARVNDFTIQPRSTATFREIAWKWLLDSEKRKWKPIKPSVICGWRNSLQNHVLPLLGDTPMSDVRNQAMRSLVTRLVAKGLSPATVKNIMQTVKLAVAFPTDDDGNLLYAVKWNSRFIGAPPIVPEKQRKPSFTGEQVSAIVRATSGREQMACILLAASGLRSGELVGLEVRHFDGESVRVEQEVWRGQVLPPKTPNARRIVDLHPDVASLLKQFIGDRRAGFILQTRSGKPMSALNLLHRGLYRALETLGFPRCGFHAFRRYRNTFLRNLHCPDGLLKFWMGHAAVDMSDRYDRVREDVQFRRDVARSLGVGFVLPETLALKPLKRSNASDSGVIGRQPEMADARK